jgi:hypothetical protein
MNYIHVPHRSIEILVALFKITKVEMVSERGLQVATAVVE